MQNYLHIFLCKTVTYVQLGINLGTPITAGANKPHSILPVHDCTRIHDTISNKLARSAARGAVIAARVSCISPCNYLTFTEGDYLIVITFRAPKYFSDFGILKNRNHPNRLPAPSSVIITGTSDNKTLSRFGGGSRGVWTKTCLTHQLSK